MSSAALLVAEAPAQAETAEYYLAQAFEIYSTKGIIIGEKKFQAYRLKILSLAHHLLELNPSSADGYSLIAMVRVGMGDIDEGIVNVNKALSLQPDNWMAYFARANAKSMLGDKEVAIVD